MSKYDPLWNCIKDKCKDTLKLDFSEIEKIVGQPIDHFFLKFKKELLQYGYKNLSSQAYAHVFSANFA